MTKWILIAGGVLSCCSVLIGAFGAHALKSVLDAKAMGWIDTAVSYQTTHALALIACGLVPMRAPTNVQTNGLKTTTALLFIVGIVLFSGSLYAMALTGSTRFAIVTPLGGVCFIAGWLSFCWMVWKTDGH